MVCGPLQSCCSVLSIDLEVHKKKAETTSSGLHSRYVPALVLLFRNLPATINRACRIDERNMRQGLRKVAQESALFRIVFFRQQSNVIAKSQKLLIPASAFGSAARHSEILDVPETARQEGRLTLLYRPGSDSMDKSIAHQMLLYSVKRIANSLILEWQKAEERDEE